MKFSFLARCTTRGGWLFLFVFSDVQRRPAMGRLVMAGDGCFAACGVRRYTVTRIRFGLTRLDAQLCADTSPHPSQPPIFPALSCPLLSILYKAQYWNPTSRVCPGMPTSAHRRRRNQTTQPTKPAHSLALTTIPPCSSRSAYPIETRAIATARRRRYISSRTGGMPGRSLAGGGGLARPD